jgi:hypothetical protein
VGGLTSEMLVTTNQNLFTTGAIDARVASVAALVGELSGAGFPMVIVSKRFNKAPRTVALVTPVISCVSTDQTVDSQRGRTRS